MFYIDQSSPTKQKYTIGATSLFFVICNTRMSVEICSTAQHLDYIQIFSHSNNAIQNEVMFIRTRLYHLETLIYLFYLGRCQNGNGRRFENGGYGTIFRRTIGGNETTVGRYWGTTLLFPFQRISA